MNEASDDHELPVSVEEDGLRPEMFCIDLDKKYTLKEFFNHININFSVQFVEVLNQQYDLNILSGVIDARILVHLKNSKNDVKKEENSTLVLSQVSGMNSASEPLQEIGSEKIESSDDDDDDDDDDSQEVYDDNDLEAGSSENLNSGFDDKDRSNLAFSVNDVKVSKPLCELCGQVFHQQRTYLRHMLSIHNEVIELSQGLKPFACSKCDLEFPARHALQKHEMEHKGYYFKCSRCKPEAALKFPTYSQLRTHYLKVHMVMKCKHCTEVCYGRINYNEHVNNAHSEHKAEKNQKGELRKFTCSTCQNIFHQAAKYEEHLMFQRNGMCFVCPICEKGMRNRKCLKYHMTTHGVGKRKQCELCDRNFAQNSALVQHMRINHPDKLPSKYRGTISCDLCGKVFRNRTHLVQHKQTAHEDVMRKCARCKRVFTSAAALSNHKHHCIS